MRTIVDKALVRVEHEQADLREIRTGFERFESDLRQLAPVSRPQQARATVGGSAPLASSTQSPDRCREVRELFAEHVQPRVGTDGESLLETVREELNERAALALAPTTDIGFTGTLKQELVSATTQRQAELETLARAIDAEADSVRPLREEISEMREWVEQMRDRSLLSLGFEELRRCHGRLTEHERRCEQLLEQRQRHLHARTGIDAAVGLAHHSLAEFLYDSLPSVYPVLSALAQLVNCCRAVRSAVREHLARRV